MFSSWGFLSVIGKRVVPVQSLSASKIATRATIAILALTTAAVGVAPVQASPSVWTIVTSANVGTGTNELNSVAVLSPTDSWAVGQYNTTSNGLERTLIEHWDGSAWNVVPSPSPANSGNSLHAVAAVSASDVWSVGDYYDSVSAQYQTLIEHWNGTGWTVVPSPEIPEGSGLFGVSAVSADDIWAVGYYLTSPYGTQPLIVHWDGASWTVIRSPHALSGSNALVKVTAVSDHIVWAVGYDVDSGGIYQTLVERWNGSKWAIVPSPHLGPGGNYLSGVTAVSPNDVWAVGYYNPSAQSIVVQTLIEHWNGHGWAIVKSPQLEAGNSAFTGVAAISAKKIWAVGVSYGSGTGGLVKTLIEHWNGRKWSVVSNPGAGRGSRYLVGVASVRGTRDIWTVGAAYPPTASTAVSGQTLTEHCC